MAKETWIYLIKDKDTGFYKIGYSDDPVKRLKKLSKQETLMPRPFDLMVVEAWAAHTDHEAYLHRIFADKRIRGEWFELTFGDVSDIYEHFTDSPKLSSGKSDSAELLESKTIFGDWIDTTFEGFGYEF